MHYIGTLQMGSTMRTSMGATRATRAAARAPRTLPGHGSRGEFIIEDGGRLLLASPYLIASVGSGLHSSRTRGLNQVIGPIRLCTSYATLHFSIHSLHSRTIRPQSSAVLRVI